MWRCLGGASLSSARICSMVARWRPSTGFRRALGHLIAGRFGVGQDLAPGPDGRSRSHGGSSASTRLLPGPSFGSRSIRPCRCAPFSRSARPLRLESLEAGSNRSGDTQVLPFSIMFLHAQVLPFSIVIYTSFELPQACLATASTSDHGSLWVTPRPTRTTTPTSRSPTSTP